MSATGSDVDRWTEADRSNGWRFGCDGLVTRRDAAAFLSTSTRHVDRLIAEGKLRRSKAGDSDNAPVRICRRSLTEMVGSLEY